MWRCGRKDKKNPPVLHAPRPREATLSGIAQREPAGIPSIVTVVTIPSQFQLSLSKKPRRDPACPVMVAERQAGFEAGESRQVARQRRNKKCL